MNSFAARLVGVMSSLMVAAAPALAGTAPAGRYATTTGTVFDTKTKLTWERSIGEPNYSPLSFFDAKTYCAGLSTSLGGSGWRVPTLKELLSIFAYAGTFGSDGTAFSSFNGIFFWTSTPDPADPRNGFVVDVYLGNIGGQDRASSFHVRCVRTGM